MTPSRYSKIQKENENVRYKIIKKKYSQHINNKSSWHRNNDIAIEKLEGLDEAIRINKINRAAGKGSWKLVPKDSCEVYKDRRRRKMEKRKRDNDDTSLSEDSQRTKSKDRLKPRQKKIKRKQSRNKKNRRRKRTARCFSGTSVTPYSSCSCMSTSASTSDMEYD